MPTRIHPTAIVSPRAELGINVEVGPHTIIEEKVHIGGGSVIGPSCLIQGPTTIGRNNHFYGHVSIGTDPQDLKYKGEESELFIGDDNRIREFTTINRGTAAGIGRTEIGSHNLLMAYTHIAHDCIIGDHVIMANASTLAGHVEIQDHSSVGAFTPVHQFCRVGRHAFIGACSVITRDVLPFMKTVGARSEGKCYGPNAIGLEREGFSPERITLLKRAYRTLFRGGVKLQDAIREIRNWPEITKDVEFLLDFIETTQRGVIR